MTLWLLSALAAPFCWAITNVLDGALRRHFIQNDTTLAWTVSAVRLPLAAAFFYIGGFSLPDMTLVFFMLLGGVIWIWPMVLYFKALEFEEPSRVSLMMQTIPVFTLIVAYFLIGETLTGRQGVAFALLFTASILAGLVKLKGLWHVSKAVPLMMIATLAWALSDVIFKKLEPPFIDFNSAFAWYVLGSGLFSLLLLFTSHRPRIIKDLKALNRRGLAILIASNSIGIAGSILFSHALTTGKASLTAVLLGIQPLFAFLIGTFLSPFLKEIAIEDAGKKALLFKLASFALVLSGLWLLSN